MTSTTFSSIKNEIGRDVKVYHAPANELRLIRSLKDYNTFPGITTNDRMCSGRRFMLCAKISPHMRTYSIRLDAGCIMSDYKDW
jgi:hypothetical protein